MTMRRKRFVAQGQVQGVGFRPFVFKLAEEQGLTGFVRNSPRGVVIEVQGALPALEAFAGALSRRLPPLARLLQLSVEDCESLAGEQGFVIAASSSGDSHAVLISPDTALCPDCLADMRAPDNRRFAYPFTNCTNCGPRYTITRSIPYDRAGTSMACFPLCPDCRAEYENPRDRRFHAQPNACPVCGPGLRFVQGAGSALSDRAGEPGPATEQSAAREAAARVLSGNDWPREANALRDLVRLLLAGGIAAIKGLGGFHLACDASDSRAVAELRRRKHRPHKPFA
ncbi:acylphosphatase, partial [Desulfovibrio sp. OttesenSCG-928-A18]|nr:acylphosphatase [Desulfovibrio sp. OttesenSCG-928-A18]